MLKKYLLVLTFALTLLLSFIAQADELILTQDALGPINKSTPFDVPTLKQLLPDYKVRKTIGVSEGNPYNIIVVYDNDKPRLTIVPKNSPAPKSIYCISFTSKRIKNSLGPAIGDRFGSIFKPGTAHCVPAHEEMSGLAICAAPNASHVVYVFVRNKRWNGSNETLPPLNVLQDWTLKQITWMPDDNDVLKDHQFCKAVNLYSH